MLQQGPRLKRFRVSMAGLACVNIIALVFVSLNMTTTYSRNGSGALADIQLWLLLQIPLSILILFIFVFDFTLRSIRLKWGLTALTPAVGLFLGGTIIERLVSHVGSMILWMVWGIQVLNITLALGLLAEFLLLGWIQYRKRYEEGFVEDIEAYGYTGQTGLEEEEGQEIPPTAIYVYRPRLSMPPPLASTSSAGRTGAAGGVAGQRQHVLDMDGEDEDTESLEELPAYQRRKPRQVALIVDMANLPSPTDAPEYSFEMTDVALPPTAALAPESNSTTDSLPSLLPVVPSLSLAQTTSTGAIPDIPHDPPTYNP